MRRMLSKTVLVGLVLLMPPVACGGFRPPPIVNYHQSGSTETALAKVAVAPFSIGGQLARVGSGSGSLPEDAKAVVERVVAEEIAAQGIEVIPAGDVRTALSARGHQAPVTDPITMAEIVVAKFGASAVLMGEVTRFHERGAESSNPPEPAIVGFKVSLHATPGGERLWRAEFSERQVALSEAPGRARRYPGRGSRWLTAAQLARFGAQAMAQALAESR